MSWSSAKTHQFRIVITLWVPAPQRTYPTQLPHEPAHIAAAKNKQAIEDMVRGLAVEAGAQTRACWLKNSASSWKLLVPRRPGMFESRVLARLPCRCAKDYRDQPLFLVTARRLSLLPPHRWEGDGRQ